MAQHDRPALGVVQVAAYAKETGATEAEIREIITIVGVDRPSIIREGRIAAEAKGNKRPLP